MFDVKTIADQAEVIVDGYAFTKCDLGVRILNLNRPGKAVVFSEKGEVLETSMDDIELHIVKDYFVNNKQFMEG